MKTLLFILITTVLLALLVISSFFEDKKYNYRIALLTALSSIILHLYIYYTTLSDGSTVSLLVSSVKSVSATIKMFGGYTLISDSDFFKVFKDNAYVVMLFYYILHIFAVAMTLSALVLTIGKRYIYVVYKSFMMLGRNDDYYIFYKYSDNVKKLIEILNNEKSEGRIIILDNDLDKKIEEYFDDLVWKKHCIILDENLKEKVLLNLISKDKYKNSKIKLFIVDSDKDENYKLAYKFYEELNKQKNHNNISLTIISDEYYKFDNMQEGNGFAYVRNFNNKDIISRMLIRKYPPCNYVRFEDCKAVNDESFDCLIIGFGELGQKIFDRLFIYGQFVNCKFNCTVIDNDFNNVCADFESKFDFILDKDIKERYSFITDNISLDTQNSFNARSKEFYNYIKKSARKLDYIVVATGQEKTNNEVVNNLLDIRNKFSEAKFDIFDCTQKRIYAFQNYDKNQKNVSRETIEIFEFILDDRIDNAGKLINYAYSQEDSNDIYNIDINEEKVKQDIDAKWKKCSAYEKNSSISAAEFYQTVLRVISKENTNDYDEVIKIINKLPKKQQEYLGELEHNRWSAFMLSEGYRYMTYDSKIGKKDDEKKLHICLVPYEGLPELNKKLEEATRENPKYKEKDFKNVIMSINIAKLIKEKK